MTVLWPMTVIILLEYKDPLRLTLALYFTLALNKWSHLTTCYMKLAPSGLDDYSLYLYLFIIFMSSASFSNVSCSLHRLLTVSYSTGGDLWPNAWLSTAQVNVTNQTTKNWCGSCPDELPKICTLITSVSLNCRLFQRAAGMKVRGKQTARFNALHCLII